MFVDQLSVYIEIVFPAETGYGRGTLIMAGEKRTEAYDLSILDSFAMDMSGTDKKSKKKKKSGQIISISKGSSAKAQRRKRNPAAILGVSLLTLLIAVILITLVHLNAKLNEMNEEINTQEKVLTDLSNKEAQYQLTIDSKFTDDYVRKYAENKLNMTPVKSAQKQFISLSDGDKAEVIEESSSGDVFYHIKKAFGL